MNTENLKIQLKQLKELLKKLKVIHNLIKEAHKLGNKIGKTPDGFHIGVHLQSEYDVKPTLEHVTKCIKSVREALKEIKLRQK